MIVLGISGVFGHDAAAALLIDDKVVCFIEEERITREKRAVGHLPINSTRWCLKKAGIQFSDIDILATGWDYRLNPNDKALSTYTEKFLSYFRKQDTKLPRIVSAHHHLAHAAYTIASSGYNECAVVVIDGHGETFSTSIGRFRDNKIEFIEQKNISQSLGHFMEAVSEHIGLGRHSVGKLMGLAGYGKATYDFQPIALHHNNYEIKFDIGTVNDSREAYRLIISIWEKYLNSFCPKNRTAIDLNLLNPDSTLFSPLDTTYKNLAATAQKYLTQCVLNICKYSLNYAQSNNLILSGGVALNCATNGALLRSNIANSIHIAPASGDAGTAIGAAILATSKWKFKNASNPFLGPSFSNDTIQKRLKYFGLKYSKPSDLDKNLAVAIANKKIVARFTGAMEAGPRALGNRSILALGNTSDIRNKLNNIKTRESWRPIAPAILSEKIKDYIVERFTSKYMLFALTPTENLKTSLQGAIHIDNTLRVQEVNKRENADFYKLIKALEYETEAPGLLNTSFNNWKEPIVCTPDDAIRTFFGSGIDILQLGSFIINK